MVSEEYGPGEKRTLQLRREPLVLLVEDEEINQAIASKILSDANLKVAIANDGETALQAVRDDPPDLILLDIVMPGMDGFEVCSRLQNDMATRYIPVIFVSALDQSTDKLRGFEVGGLDYITKPYQPEELVARVRAHLREPRPGKEVSAFENIEEVQDREYSLRDDQEFGRYRIVKRLGKGGMGEVYEAEHTTQHERVALKILLDQLSTTTAKKRFLQEGRIASSIDHRNCVKVYEVDWLYGRPFTVMELLRGGTLRERVLADGPLPIGYSVDCILQLTDGLEAAYERGILHRDIKPENCFIDNEGNVKVGDFGLATHVDRLLDAQLTAPGTFLGTPSFASPEQLRAEQLNVQSDIYSVGATLYYLLTGKVPFRAKTLFELASRVSNETVTSPRKIRSSIPKPLTKVLLKCLEKYPEKRFSDYRELREALFSARATRLSRLNFMSRLFGRPKKG